MKQKQPTKFLLLSLFTAKREGKVTEKTRAVVSGNVMTNTAMAQMRAAGVPRC
jgi:hypothetical protein